MKSADHHKSVSRVAAARRGVRGSAESNENTNRPLRQYFPEGTNLAKHTLGGSRGLCGRAQRHTRKTLGWKTPDEGLDDHLLPIQIRVVLRRSVDFGQHA